MIMIALKLWIICLISLKIVVLLSNAKLTIREKYEGKEDADVGDEQFEINDDRSFTSMYQDMEKGGLQPVLNDYIYV